MTTRWARFVRGWFVALVSTLIASVSHTVGGGAAPSALAVVVSLAFAGILCVGLAGRTLSRVRVTLAVLLSQLIFHALFSFGGAGGSLSQDALTAGSTHNHSELAGLPWLADTASASSHGADHAGWMMWLAHAIAAVLTVAALRHGEQAFGGFVEFSGRSIRALIQHAVSVLPQPTAIRRAPFTAPLDVPRDLGVLLVARPHRGPPAFVLAA